MIKKVISKKDSTKNQGFLSVGEKSEELKETKLMEKEQSKNSDMFFDKNIEIVKKDIKSKTESFSKTTKDIFSSLETAKESLEVNPATLSFKNAAISISNAAFEFFTKSKELFEATEKIYDKNKEFLSDEEHKKLNDMVKNISLVISMSIAFYKASKKMIGKIDLESTNYTEFEESLFSILDICKTVQARIASNLSSYKLEKLKVELINGENFNLFFDQVKQIDLLKRAYKTSNITFYNSLKYSSTFIRDEKRKNDEEKSKQIVKVNI